MHSVKVAFLLSVQLATVTGCGDHEPSLFRTETEKARPVEDGGGRDAGDGEPGANDVFSSDGGAQEPSQQDAAAPDGLVDAATPIDAGTKDALPPETQWVAADTIAGGVVRAGDLVTVTCLLEDAARQRFVASGTEKTVLTVVPADSAVLREDGTLLAKRAGEFAVSCSFPALDLKDSTPAKVMVRPGSATKTVTSISKATIAAGESVVLGCGAFDAYDNPVIDLTPAIRSEPVNRRNTFQANTGTFESAGTFALYCDLGGATSVPANLVVLPALPASLAVARVPEKLTYGLGEAVELAHTVTDRFGNPIATAEIAVTSEPAGTRIGDGRYSYAKAGLYRLTATVSPPTEGGVGLSKSVQVLVDAAGPVTTCDFPTDGAMLDEAPAKNLVFRGAATDVSGVKELRVNGVSTPIDAAGHFIAEVSTRFGINFIDLVAVDSGDRETKRTCAFLMSERWVPDGSLLDNSLSFWLRQPAIDDYSRIDLDSLGDVLHSALASEGLRNALDTALRSNSVLKSGCDQRLFGNCVLSSQVTYVDTKIEGPTSTQVTLVPSGLASTTRIENLGVKLRIDGQVAGLAYEKLGWVNFESIDVGTIFDVAIEGGRLRALVRPGSTATKVGRISTDSSGIEGAALEIAVQVANGVLREYVALRLQSYVTENLNGVLDGVLASLGVDAMGTRFTVARLDGGSPILLQLNAQYSSVSTNPARMLYGMGTAFAATPVLAKPTKGAPVATTLLALAPDGAESLGVAIHESVFNQGLHALWQAGYFDASLSSATPNLGLPFGMEVGLLTQLPPVAVIRGTRLELSLGGVAAQLAYPAMLPSPVPMSLGVRASMAVHLQGNALVFDDFKMEDLHLAVESTTVDASTRALVESVLPDLLEYVIGKALRDTIPALPLPRFTLPSTAANLGLPAGAQFGITSPSLEIQSPYLLLRGTPGLW